MLGKPAGQSGFAVIIAIAVVVVVAIAAVVFVVATNDGSQPEEPEVVPPALPADAELPVDPVLEQLQAAISNPDLSWPEKGDAWDNFLRETEPTPLECQQLGPNDSSLLAAIQSGLDEGDYSPDVRAFVEEMAAIMTERDILNWDDTEPFDQQVAGLVEYFDQMAQLALKYGAELSPNNDGVLLCLHFKPQPLQGNIRGAPSQPETPEHDIN